MKTENIFYLSVGAIIGWYLCTTKRKETEQALSLAKKEANKLANDLQDMVDRNIQLSEQVVTEDVQNNFL